MKKIINAPNAVVSEMLQGIEKANPKIIYYPGAEVIARKEKTDGRSALYLVVAVVTNLHMLGMSDTECWMPR